jgi:hypothetical protein
VTSSAADTHYTGSFYCIRHAQVPLNDTVEMVPYAVGNACYAMILKDSNFNSWHQYT